MVQPNYYNLFDWTIQSREVICIISLSEMISYHFTGIIFIHSLSHWYPHIICNNNNNYYSYYYKADVSFVSPSAEWHMANTIKMKALESFYDLTISSHFDTNFLPFTSLPTQQSQYSSKMKHSNNFVYKRRVGTAQK